VSKQAGARIETVPEVLIVLYFEEERPSYTSRTWSWSRSLRWLDSLQQERRVMIGVVGSRAAQEGACTAFPKLLYRAFRYGSPRLWHVLPFLVYWLIPQGFQRQLRGLFRGWARAAPLDRPGSFKSG
jgi:hypothetical protein